MHIFVSGSLAFDRIMDFPERFSDHILPDKIHVLNVCFLVNGVTERFGGTAGNIAYNLAMLDEKPLILATAGKDFAEYRAWLESMGLPLDGIRVLPDELTAGAYITTDKSDNQITGFNPGAMKFPSEYTVNDVDPAECLAIVAPGNVDDMLNYSAQYREKAIPYIFDPGQQIPAIGPERIVEMVTGSKMLISNDYELEMISRATGLGESELMERTESIVTTLGERGAIVNTRSGRVEVAAAKINGVADPTGAGDAFRAGLIKGLMAGKTVEESAKMGAITASFSVECQGTQCHRFNIDDFWQRYEATFGPAS